MWGILDEFLSETYMRTSENLYNIYFVLKICNYAYIESIHTAPLSKTNREYHRWRKRPHYDWLYFTLSQRF